MGATGSCSPACSDLSISSKSCSASLDSTDSGIGGFVHCRIFASCSRASARSASTIGAPPKASSSTIICLFVRASRARADVATSSSAQKPRAAHAARAATRPATLTIEERTTSVRSGSAALRSKVPLAPDCSYHSRICTTSGPPLASSPPGATASARSAAP